MYAREGIIRHTNRQPAIQAAKQDNELDKARSLGRAYISSPVHFPVIVSVTNGTSFPVKLETRERVKEAVFQMMDDGCTQIKVAALLKKAYPKLHISQSLISKWIVDQRRLQDHVARMQAEQLQAQIPEDSAQSTSDQVDSK